MLHLAAERFALDSVYSIVEPAHMELAEPSIAAAFDRCVKRGARRVVVFPYFLSPGRHWTEDIPRLVSEAAQRYPAVEWLVTAPFGLHPTMNSVITDRIGQCLRKATAAGDSPGGCDVCEGTSGCQLHRGERSTPISAGV